MPEAADEDLAARVEATALALRAAAVEAGMAVSGDGRVSETNAATLLAIETETLSKRRQEGKGPVSYRVPLNGSRVSYRLDDLARWVESHREDF